MKFLEVLAWGGCGSKGWCGRDGDGAVHVLPAFEVDGLRGLCMWRVWCSGVLFFFFCDDCLYTHRSAWALHRLQPLWLWRCLAPPLSDLGDGVQCARVHHEVVPQHVVWHLQRYRPTLHFILDLDSGTLCQTDRKTRCRW